MNNVLVMAIVALIAGFGGALIHAQLDTGSGAGAGTETGDAALLADKVADLERKLAAMDAPGATLRGAAPAPGTGPAASTDEVVEAVLAKMGEQVDERVTSKFEELAKAREDEGGSSPRTRRRGKKRLSLRDAAEEIGLSGSEEDELRRIYDDSMNRFMKLAAGKDGDVEDVKRDLEAAKKNPAAARGLFMKYVPNMMSNMGELMTIQAEREAAVVKAIGPEKAKKLNDEFDVIEANPIGGGGMRFETRMEGDMPGGGR